MKIPSLRRLLKSLIILLVLYSSVVTFAPLAFQVSAQNTPPPDCPPTYPVPCTNPQTKPKNEAWPRGANVTVNIDPTFNAEKRAAVEQSLRNWQNAGGSGVTFTFTYNQNPPSMTLDARTEHRCE